MDIISDLKERSGKATKMKTLDIIKLDQQHETVVFLILMANLSSKIAVVGNNTDLQKFSIKKGEIFILKNFLHVESISDVPIFKITQKTAVRQSGMKNMESLSFTSNEVTNLKTSIKMDQYIVENAVIEPVPVETGDILSLFQFCQKPTGLGPGQYVEVIQSVLYKTRLFNSIKFDFINIRQMKILKCLFYGFI